MQQLVVLAPIRPDGPPSGAPWCWPDPQHQHLSQPAGRTTHLKVSLYPHTIVSALCTDSEKIRTTIRQQAMSLASRLCCVRYTGLLTTVRLAPAGAESPVVIRLQAKLISLRLLGATSRQARGWCSCTMYSEWPCCYSMQCTTAAQAGQDDAVFVWPMALHTRAAYEALLLYWSYWRYTKVCCICSRFQTWLEEWRWCFQPGWCLSRKLDALRHSCKWPLTDAAAAKDETWN